MTLFKTVDTTELQARKAAAEEQFRGRKSGINHFAGNDPVTGRPVGGYVEGGIEAVLVKYAEDLIPTYIEYTAKGYTLTSIGVVSINASTWEIYMNRPEDQIKPLLDVILQKVEDDYLAEVQTYNDAIVDKAVAEQLAMDERREAKELAEAAKARRERVEAEVRAALTAPVKEAKSTTRERK
ncbi:hypothetical protein [Pseudomonas gingeri]|uniref:Uncharacterized protein n=1 Tax=Pseudomonas gingeri TaxID=117681 RepID=A0A7Y7Y8C1_9PSED|nr:hypothetical protein [Pseudomonas gingeri]NWB27291.1 hypothetical protein [Pseudomonas gingeri]NWC31712.1 hypothetical protein [Pseudomonas gingeri]